MSTRYTRNGVKIRIPGMSIKEALFGPICIILGMFVGALTVLVIMTHTKAMETASLARELANLVDKADNHIETQRIWLFLMDERQTELQSNLNRIHFETGVPKDEDAPASHRYRMFMETDEMKYQKFLYEQQEQ